MFSCSNTGTLKHWKLFGLHRKKTKPSSDSLCVHYPGKEKTTESFCQITYIYIWYSFTIRFKNKTKLEENFLFVIVLISQESINYDLYFNSAARVLIYSVMKVVENIYCIQQKHSFFYTKVLFAQIPKFTIQAKCCVFCN